MDFDAITYRRTELYEQALKKPALGPEQYSLPKGQAGRDSTTPIGATLGPLLALLWGVEHS